MKKHLKLVLPVILVLALILSGCSAAPKSGNVAAAEAPMAAPQMESSRAVEDAAYDTTAVEGEAGGWGNNDMAETKAADENSQSYGGHKIIKNAGIGIETKEFDKHLEYIRTRVEELGGYISNSNVYGKVPETYYDSGRSANVTARVPQDRMEAFLADARGLATVTYENTSGDDITSQYYDTESRLKVYTTQRDRMMTLLESAENMEDIIALETELSRLTYEIESLTSSLKFWDDLVDFATVTVDLREIPPSSSAASSETMGSRIGDGFSNTLNGLKVFFEDFIVFVIAASPVLIVLAVIAVVVILIIRKTKPKREAKREAIRQRYSSPLGGYGAAQKAPEKPSNDKEK